MSDSKLWFTRVTIKCHAPDVAPLINTLLNPEDEGRRLNTTHRMLWTLMPEQMRKSSAFRVEGDNKAAFLWRTAPNRFGASSWYLLGPRPREDSAFFEVETKPWAPFFAIGDRLAFDITVNATVNRMVDPAKGRNGRQRADVVMDAVHLAERSGAETPRALLRSTLADEALKNWWLAQGRRNGFSNSAISVVNYATVPLEGRRSARFGIGHLTGILEVNEPEAFTKRVEQGFGRAKAFGCGLLLLRRV
jgi:CRISPR system Cascade subunit CasE